MPNVKSLAPWNVAAELAGLHVCRTRVELEAQFVADLVKLLPGVAFALCLAELGEGLRVRFVHGDVSGLQPGSRAAVAAQELPAAQHLTVRYRGYALGEMLFGGVLSADDAAIATAATAHFGTALGNLTLNEETRQATTDYCASLQALEEGIILFQEEDPEAVTARLLSLATSMAQSSAGALFVLREVGDTTSGLALEQTLGIPESLVRSFRGADGRAWPEALLGQQARLEMPGEDGSLAKLAPECVPAALRNLVVLPLRYHGVEAGVCLLFNAGFDAANESEHLSRVQSLGQLGAALLHRLRLEALNARNRSRERELQIAETIQKRLLPTASPATPGFAFAWDSIAAQNIGGDYLDVFSHDAREVHAVIADASGHGINSALLMSSFRSTYRANAPRMTVGQLVESLNNEVTNEVGPTGMFITAVLLRIDCVAMRLCMTSAGHTPVMHYRARTGSITQIESNGPPLGFLHGADYTTDEVQLEAGDLLLLYTDGVTEATNADLDMFGDDRLVALLQRHGAGEPQAILAAIRADLAAFTGRDRYEDDVSLVVIRVR